MRPEVRRCGLGLEPVVTVWADGEQDDGSGVSADIASAHVMTDDQGVTDGGIDPRSAEQAWAGMLDEAKPPHPDREV